MEHHRLSTNDGPPTRAGRHVNGPPTGVVATLFQQASNRGSPITVMVPSSLIAEFLQDDELAKITAC